MKKIVAILFLFTIVGSVSAQEDEHRGTIKVERKGMLAKVVFDDVNYRLIGIDQYGNPLDTAVVQFSMSVTIKGTHYSENAMGPFLSVKMRELLGRCDSSSTLFFENIKARDRGDYLISIPKFQHRFANTNENSD